MSFDLAVGLSGDQMNAAAAGVYQALHDKNQVFSGSLLADHNGVKFTIDYDVQAAPGFDLGTASPQAFTLSLPKVALTLKHGDTSTQLMLALTAPCQVLNEAGQVCFVPQSVSAPAQSDPVNDYLVKTFVLPAIKTMLTQLLAGVQIPSIQVADIKLTPASVGIVHGYVIAAVNVAGGGAGPPPPPDTSFPWPTTPFFALLGNGVVNQLAVKAITSNNHFPGHSDKGDHWAGSAVDYDFVLANPRAQIQGAGLKLQFSLTGSLNATVWFLQVATYYNFNGNASPDPTVNAAMIVANNQLVVQASSADDFTIQFNPGNFGAWLLALFSVFLQALALAVPLLVKAHLQNLQLAAYAIPAYSIVVGGTTLALTPTDLSVSNVGGMIALTGNAKVAPS
jgi:hypothetical protein